MSDAAFICRRLTVQDVELILDMNKNFRAGFAEKNAVLRFLSQEDHWFFAAVRDHAVIGFAYGCAINRLDGTQKMLYLHEVGVMENFQRQGVGTRLMQELKKACKQENIGKCFLITDQGNAAANALYQKTGGQWGRDSQGRDVMYFFRTE